MQKIASKTEMLEYMTAADCAELRKLITENPELPLLVFVGDGVLDSGYQYTSASSCKVDVTELVLFGDRWIPKEEFYEELEEDIGWNQDYDSLSSEEFEAAVDKKFDETEFIKAITLYIG